MVQTHHAEEQEEARGKRNKELTAFEMVISFGCLFLVLPLLIERFSFEYRKTKTKVITLANHKGHRHTVNQLKLEVITCS